MALRSKPLAPCAASAQARGDGVCAAYALGQGTSPLGLIPPPETALGAREAESAVCRGSFTPTSFAIVLPKLALHSLIPDLHAADHDRDHVADVDREPVDPSEEVILGLREEENQLDVPAFRVGSAKRAAFNIELVQLEALFDCEFECSAGVEGVGCRKVIVRA